MKIYKDIALREFDFWSGAADTAQYLMPEELDILEEMLEGDSPDGMSETDVNDFIWFETDLIAEWLGYSTFDEIITREED